MGNIRTKYLLYMIDKILIPNFPVTRNYLKTANDILGKITKFLRVNTVHKSL